jgi:predicted Zn-dependent protease
MRNLLFALLLLALCSGEAAAHGDISKLPDSVQIMQYKMLLYMNADDAETKNDLAMAYFRTGKLDEAAGELNAVLAKEPGNFDALDGMGIVLLRQKKAEDGLRYLKRAAAVNEKDAMLLVHLSIAYQQLNQAEQAAEAMKKAEQMAAGPEAAAAIQKEIQLITKS